MNAADRAAIESIISTSIAKTVNGKIDRLTEKVDHHHIKHEEDMKDVREHMELTRPFIEAYQGGRALGSLAKLVAGVGAAVLIINSWLAGKL